MKLWWPCKVYRLTTPRERRMPLSCRSIEAKTRQKLTGGEVDINEVYAEKDEVKAMEEEAEKEDELEFDLSEPAATAA